jgi:vitamin B12 transporter
MRIVSEVLMLLWLLAAVPAAAQEAKPEGKTVETKTVNPVVVTATTVATAATELGVALSVVTENDFRTYHYATVDEALRNLPGVEIRRSGSLGKTSSLSIRGANSNQVQVLVDGVRVKSPTLGQVDLSDLSPDLIERIEIIRGPQSTLYGADAIGGVVNIITKKGTGPFQASVQQEVGNYDTLQSRFQASGAWKVFNYAFSASHLESNGQFQNDGSNINALNGRLGVSLPFDSSLSFIVRYNKTDTGVPVKGVFPGPQPIDPIINPNAKQQSETTVMLLEAKTRPVTWWESTARISRYENNFGFQDPVDPGVDFDSPIFAQINVVRREAEWLNSIHLGSWSTSTVGLGYRHEEGENKGVFHTARHVPSVFFEQQFRFFDRLFLTGGVRNEDDSVFGSATTEHGSLAFAIKETGTRIRGSAGTGFRAPTFNDLFFPDFGTPASSPSAACRTMPGWTRSSGRVGSASA